VSTLLYRGKYDKFGKSHHKYPNNVEYNIVYFLNVANITNMGVNKFPQTTTETSLGRIFTVPVTRKHRWLYHSNF
jgi:hypothetical protein